MGMRDWIGLGMGMLRCVIVGRVLIGEGMGWDLEGRDKYASEVFL